MKANLLLLILIIGFNSSLVAQTSQVITDSVTINGRVTDYDNHPLDNVSVSWARPDFSEVSVTLTDKMEITAYASPRENIIRWVH